MFNVVRFDDDDGWSLTDFPAPTLHLDLANVETLNPGITYTCASTRTYFNSSGQLATAAINEWPREYDPTTLAPIGRSLWEARTNLLLNSTIDGANLATQNITTTAAARTISFYGTGTVTLSGTHAAVVAGTGAFPTRTTYTYTPTAGTLTVTVSGTVQFAQDELGAFTTPWIPTDGAAATRAATLASMTGTNFSSWYNQTEGAFVTTVLPINNIAGATRRFLEVSDGTTLERIVLGMSATSGSRLLVTDGGVTQADVGVSANQVGGVMATYSAAYKANSFVQYSRGTGASDVSGTIPTPSAMYIGNDSLAAASSCTNGWLSRLTYYPKRLSDSILGGLSS